MLTYAHYILDCRQGNLTDAEWLNENFGPFAIYLTYSDLKFFNLSQVIHAFFHQSAISAKDHYKGYV